MTDQERQLIEGLATRIQNAPPPQVDRDADDLIRRGIGSRPDALYILAQTVLIQEMALNQAKAQIEDLKQNAPRQNSSFLGQAPQPSGYQGSNYQRDNPAPPPPSYQPQYAPPQYAPQYDAPPPQSGGRFSGFLHNAAQTAAGIVAGEVAFSAISSIFGGHGGGGGFFGGGGGSGFFGGNPGISPGSETIVNNYYGEGQGQGLEHGSGFPSSDGGLSPDVEDRRFAGNDSNQAADDSSQQDDSTNDSADDGSSYDDGGGSSDDGGGSSDDGGGSSDN